MSSVRPSRAKHGFALEGRTELIDVVLAHPGQEVQIGGVEWTNAGDHEGREGPIESRGARQCVRPAARPPRDDARLDSEGVKHLVGVVDDIRHAPPRVPRRPPVTGAGGRDDPEPVPIGGNGERMQ